jgi:hypothetical protein
LDEFALQIRRPLSVPLGPFKPSAGFTQFAAAERVVPVASARMPPDGAAGVLRVALAPHQIRFERSDDQLEGGIEPFVFVEPDPIEPT